jgi:hypothetical protein
MCASTNSALVAQARMRQISRLSLKPWCSSSSSSPLHGRPTTSATREHRGVTPTLAASRLVRLHVDIVLSMSRLPCALVPAMDAHTRGLSHRRSALVRCAKSRACIEYAGCFASLVGAHSLVRAHAWRQRRLTTSMSICIGAPWPPSQVRIGPLSEKGRPVVESATGEDVGDARMGMVERRSDDTRRSVAAMQFTLVD